MKTKSPLQLGMTLAVPELCECGSGKKTKRCCKTTKPRDITIDIDPVNLLYAEGLSIGLDRTLKRFVADQHLPLLGETSFTQSYKRPSKGDKVLLSGVQNQEHILNPEALLLGYDAIFFIDTNTKNIGGDNVSVATVIYGFSRREDSGRTVFSYAPQSILEFWNPRPNAERLAWSVLQEGIKGNDELAQKSIAIVVDSALGDLPEINARRQPIIEGHYLAQNIRLMYATTDNGGSAINRLMRICDKQSNNTLRFLACDPQRETLEAPNSYPCEYFRQWNPRHEHEGWTVKGFKKRK